MPPISGATMGATTMTVATSPIIEAARSRANRSRMIARPMTTPVEAPSACRMRNAISPVMVDAAIEATLDTTVSARPARTTGRRPKRSDSGPEHQLRAGEPDQIERDGELDGPMSVASRAAS